MNLILAFVPDEAIVLVIALVGLGLMCRIITGRAAASIIGGLVLMLLIGPFVEALLGTLPMWLSIVIAILLLLSLLRALSALVLGRHASDHMVGILAADVVRFAFRALLQLAILPFRVIGWIAGRVS